MNIAGFARGELVGANDDLGFVSKGLKLPLPDGRVVGLGFQDAAVQEELLGHFLEPLLAQVCGRDDQNPPLALRPLLGEHQARLDGLAQANLIGEQGTLG
jgi:hypothetical protein